MLSGSGDSVAVVSKSLTTRFFRQLSLPFTQHTDEGTLATFASAAFDLGKTDASRRLRNAEAT
jgi:hypothetical protein